jgi:hypothetical protein
MAIISEQFALRHLKSDKKTNHEHTSKFCAMYLTSKFLMVVATKITLIWNLRQLVRETYFKTKENRISYYYKQFFGNISSFDIL